MNETEQELNDSLSEALIHALRDHLMRAIASGDSVIDVTNYTENYNVDMVSFIFYNFNERISTFSEFNPLEKTMLIVLYTCVCVFGIVSNTLLIIAFYRAEKLRTTRNSFIINLAICDILLCLICAPLTLVKYMYFNWSYGRVLCKLLSGLQTTSVLVAGFSITAIAIDRWQFIVHPGRDISKKIGSFAIILITWLIGVLASTPSYFLVDQRTVVSHPPDYISIDLCEESSNRRVKHAYIVNIIVFQYVVPLVIISATNFKICHYLYLNVPSVYKYRFRRPDENNNRNTSSQNTSDNLCSNCTALTNRSGNIVVTTPSEPPPNHNDAFSAAVVATEIRLLQQHPAPSSSELVTISEPVSSFVHVDGKCLISDSERFRRSKIILVIVCVCFALCWLPLLVLNIYADVMIMLNKDPEVNQYYNAQHLLAHLIAISTCCINPILYGLLNSNFKEEFVRMYRAVRTSAAPTTTTAVANSDVREIAIQVGPSNLAKKPSAPRL